MPAVDAKEAITLTGPEWATRGGNTVRVGPKGFILLSLLLRTGKARLAAVKVRGWGSRDVNDTAVYQATYRLNEKLAELGDPRQVAVRGGDVVLY